MRRVAMRSQALTEANALIEMSRRIDAASANVAALGPEALPCYQTSILADLNRSKELADILAPEINVEPTRKTSQIEVMKIFRNVSCRQDPKANLLQYFAFSNGSLLSPLMMWGTCAANSRNSAAPPKLMGWRWRLSEWRKGGCAPVGHRCQEKDKSCWFCNVGIDKIMQILTLQIAEPCCVAPLNR